MKLPFDKDYFKISLYAVISVSIISIFVCMLINLGFIVHNLQKFLLKCLSLAAPVLSGVIIAFMLEPLVAFYEKIFGEKIHKKRFFAVFISFLTVFAVIFIFVFVLCKSIGSEEISDVSEKINFIIYGFFTKLDVFQQKISKYGVFSFLNVFLNCFLNSIQIGISRFAPMALQSVSLAGEFIMNVAVGTVLAFYFLLEKKKIILRLKELLYIFFPKKFADTAVIFFNDVNFIFSGYISGQITDAVIMAGLFSAVFYFGKIKYAFLIGTISGFLNLIPYIGAVAAAVLSSFAALAEGSVSKAVYVIIAVIIIQQIDSALISPKVVGKSVSLHPVLVIISLSVFASLWGIPSMIFAVPVTAVLKLNFERLVNFKKKKDV